jgi:hypothetical protein
MEIAMATRRTAATLVLAIASAAAAIHVADARAEHFDATLSTPQIELKFKRIRAAHELEIDRPLPWIYAFSGAEPAKLEALSLRLVRDGFHIESLQTAEGVTTLRVARTEHLTPAALERRSRELAKLAAISGVRSYDGADVGAER